ncbi:phosphatase PAP2 family protein [bacterium]|nr:phosphatase PAP2 family protein [bacterium]
MAVTLRRHLVQLSLRRMNYDRLTVVYLLLSAFYPVLKPSVFPQPWANAALHGGLALFVWFVPPLLRGSRHIALRLLGEIYLPLIFPLFYAEMEYLGVIYFPFENSLDPALIRLEQWLFGFQPSLEWSRAWPWPWFHELMEFAYFTYYFLAAAYVWLLMRAPGLAPEPRWDALRDFVRDLSVTMLICYTFYTLFPAWGPKYFRLGHIEVGGGPFTAIMRHIHENGAILGAAFPSSHVAASLVPWWHTWIRFPRHRWWMTTLFVLLCMSTVYNRYHYVVDVIAGLLLGALVMYGGARLGDTARDRLRRWHR